MSTMVDPKSETPPKNAHLAYIEHLSDRFCARFGRDNLAYTLLFIAAMMYPFCFIYVSQKNYTAVQANLVRGVSIFSTHYLIGRYLGMDMDFKKTRNNKYLFIRSMIMLINQIAYTAMHYVVSLPVINILNISGSIFAFVIDYYMYGTQIHPEQIPGIVVGCIGVAITVNGELILSMFSSSYDSHSEFHNYMVQSMGLKILFSSLYILASMLWAFGLVIQKQIKDTSGLKISYHSGIIFAFGTALVYPVTVVNPISLSEFFKGCAVSGLLHCIVQILFTTAFNISQKSGVLTMITTFTLIPSYFVSMFTYEESLNPVCVVGMVLLAWGLFRTIQYGQQMQH